MPTVSNKKDSNVLTQDQRKTFSKRKIVSNWAKYDEGMHQTLIWLQSGWDS